MEVKMEIKSKKIMGLILALVMLVGCLSLNPIATYAEGDVAINETNFPDENFRNYVSENFDDDNNGFLSQSECDKVEKINISQSFDTEDNSKKVKSLKGLDLFKNLNGLYCENNQLTNLDLSKNTKLEILRCYNNDIKELDLSKNTKLKELSCPHNQLTNLDLSKNTELQILECHDNSLTSLDASKNTTLTKLDCYNNQLTSLDLSGDTALEHLKCNYNQLTSLDLSGDTALTDLECYNNQLTSLDVSDNPALTDLYCDNNQLTSLDVSKNTALTRLGCANNQLTSLDVSGDTALEDLKCNDNQLTSLDVSDMPALILLFGNNNPMTYVKLPDGYFYKSLSPVTYTVRVTEGSSKIPFTALPQGFDSSRIQPDTLTGVKMEKDGFNWNMATNPIKFKYKLWDKPEKNDAKLREADDEESGFVDAELRVLILEVVGPVDPNKTPNPNPDKYWTVKFESEDTSKGTVAAENTFYVLKTANKTLADLASKAPEVTAKTGFKFTGWNPALDANTSINGNLTVNATFEEVTPTPAPIEYKRDHTPSIPVIVNVAKTMKLSVKLIIGSKEMIKSVDGVEEKIMMDVAPFIENGRTMLPIRFVAEALGFNVRWDKDSRTVILIDKENVVKIPVDTNKIIVNGKEYTSDVKPVIKNDRTMLPIANIARALGLKDGKDIHWNENTKEVIITREIVK